MSNPHWVLHDDATTMGEAVAVAVTDIVNAAIEARGHALIALPGGSTPRPALKALRRASLDWSRIIVVPTDDRIVARNDALSNAAMLGNFLDENARIVPLVPDASIEYAQAGDAANSLLQDLPWPLDLAWLGVGEDGHTASLFPGPDLRAALEAPLSQRAIGVRPDPMPAAAPVARITLTRATLCAARKMLITISGAHKRQLLEQTITREPHGSPIGQLLAQAQMPLMIHWSRT